MKKSNSNKKKYLGEYCPTHKERLTATDYLSLSWFEAKSNFQKFHKKCKGYIHD